MIRKIRNDSMENVNGGLIVKIGDTLRVLDDNTQEAITKIPGAKISNGTFYFSLNDGGLEKAIAADQFNNPNSETAGKEFVDITDSINQRIAENVITRRIRPLWEAYKPGRIQRTSIDTLRNSQNNF